MAPCQEIQPQVILFSLQPPLHHFDMSVIACDTSFISNADILFGPITHIRDPFCQLPLHGKIALRVANKAAAARLLQSALVEVVGPGTICGPERSDILSYLLFIIFIIVSGFD